MVSIEYVEADEQCIDLVKPLWEQLNEHHRRSSPHFTHHYETFTFEQRKKALLGKGGLMHITLAKDTGTGRIVGYCVSTVIQEPDRRVGEIDSIFVDNGFRSQGIGDTLMARGLRWMDDAGVDVKRVSVGTGNESVWPFYRKYGFYPRMTTLEQKKK